MSCIANSQERVLSVDERIGDWRVLAFMTRGGCGEVYRVTHIRTGAVAALKVLYRDDPALRARFVLESDILQQMASYIAPGTSCFPHFLERGHVHDDKRPYVVIEELREFGLPETDSSVAIFITKMCLAVSELHKNGYLHRDIKPANVMCRADGEPVIIDFGFATRLDVLSAVPPSERLSMTDGTVCGVGTVGSSAPEQVIGEATVRSDVYALGALMNDCFHGNPPAAWVPIIRKALDPKPEYRYATPNRLAEAIRCRTGRDCWKLVGRAAGIIGVAGGIFGILTNVVRLKSLDDRQALREYSGACAVCAKEASLSLACSLLEGDGVAKDEGEAFRMFEILAERGDADAMRYLADCYGKGIGCVSNLVASVDWLFRSSELGDAEAKFRLYEHYEKGEGVKEDLSRAKHYLEEAADQGSPSAMLKLGRIRLGFIETRLDIPYEATEGLALLSRVYDIKEDRVGGCQQRAKAAVLLGNCYMYGQGVPVDLVEARQRYQRAIEDGFHVARYQMALSYQGTDDNRCIDQLLKFVRSHGLSKGEAGQAKLQLAEMLQLVKHDEVGYDFWLKEAASDLREAAEAGSAEAWYDLGEMAFKHTLPGADVTNVVFYFKEAAKRNLSRAENALGYLYRYGHKNVQQDKDMASYWFYRAAERGNAVAMANLGGMYYQGEVRSGTNDEAAVHLFERSSRRGFLLAKLCLAECYRDGRGVEQDYGRAVLLLEEAFESGNITCARLLGEMYYGGGPGLPADPTKAVGYFEKLLKQTNSTTALGRNIVRDCHKIEEERCLVCLWLARALIEGRGVSQDFSRAEHLIGETITCTKSSVVELRRTVQRELESSFARGNYKPDAQGVEQGKDNIQ